MDFDNLPIGRVFTCTDDFGRTARLRVQKMDERKYCSECAFDECSCATEHRSGRMPHCTADRRADKTDVVFVRVT